MTAKLNEVPTVWELDTRAGYEGWSICERSAKPRFRVGPFGPDQERLPAIWLYRALCGRCADTLAQVMACASPDEQQPTWFLYLEGNIKPCDAMPGYYHLTPHSMRGFGDSRYKSRAPRVGSPVAVEHHGRQTVFQHYANGFRAHVTNAVLDEEGRILSRPRTVPTGIDTWPIVIRCPRPRCEHDNLIARPAHN